MPNYLKDHIKMDVLRGLAEEMPNGMIASTLKLLDDELDKQVKEKLKEIESKKKHPAFITKF